MLARVGGVPGVGGQQKGVGERPALLGRGTVPWLLPVLLQVLRPRTASCRQAAGEDSSTSATVSKSMSNTSCSRNAARSSGLSRSSSSSRPNDRSCSNSLPAGGLHLLRERSARAARPPRTVRARVRAAFSRSRHRRTTMRVRYDRSAPASASRRCSSAGRRPGRRPPLPRPNPASGRPPLQVAAVVLEHRLARPSRGGAMSGDHGMGPGARRSHLHAGHPQPLAGPAVPRAYLTSG